MRKFRIIVFALLSSTLVQSQTVENIRVEPDGNNIRITYRIGGSTENDLYHIKLECSIDRGSRFEPRSVIGDVGNNITGGKSFYMIVWEVFKDMEEIGEAEFFITIEKAEGDIASIDPDKRREIFAGYSGSETAPVGISAGYLGNWGFYASFRAGFDGHLSITGGATKQLFQKDSYRMHAYAGVGRADYLDEYAIEAGIVNVAFNRVSLNLGLAVPAYFVELTFGLGLVF